MTATKNNDNGNALQRVFYCFRKGSFFTYACTNNPQVNHFVNFFGKLFSFAFSPEYHSFILFSISNFNEPYIHRHLSKPLLLYLHFLDQFGFHLHFLLLHSHLILLCQPLISPLLK